MLIKPGENVNIITSEDDASFFDAVISYSSKMSAFDNYEFRQAVMDLLKPYRFKFLLEQERQEQAEGRIEDEAMRGAAAMKKESQDGVAPERVPEENPAAEKPVTKKRVLSEVDDNSQPSTSAKIMRPSLALAAIRVLKQQSIKKENVQPPNTASAKDRPAATVVHIDLDSTFSDSDDGQ